MRGRLLVLVVSLGIALPSPAAITGSLMSSEGQPVAGARLTLHSSETVDARRTRLVSEKPERLPLATAETDAKGRFTFDSPKEPVVVLRVAAPGFAPTLMAVERDEDLGGLSMASAMSKTGRISAGGKPVAGARVIWLSATEIVATTDAEGRYSVPDPSKWAERVIVVHPDYALHEETTRRFATGNVSPDQTLQQGVKLSGRVVGEDGKSPVNGAILLSGGWPVGTSGDDGSFTIPRLNSKWERIEARSGALVGVRAKGSDPTATIRLARASSVSGSVRDSRTQAAVPGAEVVLRRSGRFDGATITSALTDAKGNFSLAGLAPGAYDLMSAHPGYSFSGASAAVAAGERASRTILGTQLARVTGTVVNEEKQQVAGAAIAAQNVSRQGGMFPSGPMMMMMGGGGVRVSAPDGRFAIRVQPDADMQVEARKKGFPNGRSSTVRLAAGERKSGVVITVPGGMNVTGRVVDGDGKPVAGVSVIASEARAVSGGQVRQMIMGAMRNRDDENIQTAADGTFALRVKEGSYDFGFKRDGYAQKLVRATQVNATTKPIEVTLEPGVEIAGRITRNGMGVPGVRVGVFGEGDSGDTETGGDGSFRIGNLSPGSMMLNAMKEDEFIQQFRPVTAPAIDLLIEIPPGGRIAGRVVDKNTKRPVTSFDAGVNTPRGGGGMMIMGPSQSRPFTADDGAFVLDNVPAGTTNLVVNAPGYTTARVPNVNVEEGKATAEIEVAMDRGVKVTGKVTGPDGSPLSGVSVRADMASGRVIRMPGSGNMTVSDGGGEYTLETQEPGERTFIFNRTGYVSTNKTVSLTGTETRVDAQLSSGIRVSGVVVLENGTPVSEASVSAFSAADPGGASTRSDQNGAFQIEGLAPGRYTFRAAKQGFPGADLRDADITTGAPVRLVIRSGGTIYGRVSGLSAGELAQTIVSASSPVGSGSAPVDAVGNYRIEGAPTGTVRISARTAQSFAGGKSSPVKSLQLDAGSSVQQDIEFLTGTAVRGRVTREGRGVSGAMVSFSPRNAQAQTRSGTQTDSDGNYEVTGLEDATYNVMVADIQRGAPFTTTYEVRGSGTFNIDMKSTSLRGRVVDASTGEPVPEAAVEIRERETGGGGVRFAMRTIQTDAGGAFVIDPVSTGSYHLSAEKEGYGTKVVDVTVGESPSEVEIKLTPNPGVTLRIVDGRDGRPLLNAFVRVTDSQNRIVYETPMRFNAAGNAELKIGLESGTYRAMVSASGYAPGAITISSPSKQTVGLTPGGAIVVRSQSGEMRRARLMGSDGREYPRNFGGTIFTVDPSPGVTQMDNIAPGGYTLQILGTRDEVLTSVQVNVGEGQRAVVDI